MKLQGINVLVTGAAKRVGRVIAETFAARGANLVLHYHRSEKDAVALKKKLERKFGVRVELLRGDLSDWEDARRVANQAWKDFGPIDVLVNNASTFYPTPLGKLTQEQWRDLFSVNVQAPYLLSENLGLKMKRRKRGKIVNIADWSALRPYTSYLPYCASKAALVAVSQGLAKSLAPHVQVNTVLPGPVLWPKELGESVKASVLGRTPLKKIGTPEDVANAVRFLVEDGDFMTGTLLHVDGGRNID